MEIILWIVFGGLVGWVASRIMKTYVGMGVMFNVGIGACGAVMGGWIMKLIGQNGVGSINLYSFLVALLGAIILIWIIETMRRITSKN